MNADGKIRGQLDVALTETGRQEAAALGRLLGGLSIARVISSPLSRAVDTATPIAATAGVPLVIDARLRDRFYGQWAGRPSAEVEERFGSVGAAPGVEPWADLTARAKQAFTDLVDTGAGDTDGRHVSALVSHDAVLRSLISALVPSLISGEIDLPTGSWSSLERVDPSGVWHVTTLGERPVTASREPNGAHRP